MKRFPIWSWVWVLVGGFYFLAPLFGTLLFSLQKERGRLSLSAFQNALADPFFARTFAFSSVMAALTIAVSILLIVPTAYWIHLRYHRVRAVVDFLTLLPFVIPPIVLVLGLIRTYSHHLHLGSISVPALTEVSTESLLLGGYMILSLPFIYRSVDNGLRAMDVRVLSEAGQSLGASWLTILWRIILPNLRTSLLSGALLTFAVVLGEFTLSGFFVGDQRAFGPYLVIIGSHHAYDAAALTLLSFAVTWAAMLLIQFVTRGQQAQVAGGH
jgi:putative spermidine/putrescine transport system permease protein